jgi:PAS domain S-box-containing protein
MDKAISQEYYKSIFQNSRAAQLIVAPDAPIYTMLDVNEAYLTATHSTREALIGKGVFTVFPANPSDEVSKNIERTIFSFDQAITTKKPHIMYNYRYDIPIPGTGDFEERYWITSNTPVLDEEGNVIFFIHSPENVTQLYKISEKEKQATEALKFQRAQLLSTFIQAPVGIGIFKGENYTVDLINPPLCELYGLPLNDLLGKNVFEAMPHVKGQGFEELLDNVRITGKSYQGNDVALSFTRNGKLETVYVNFVYEPFKEDDGTISGVICIAIDVTNQVLTKHQLEEAVERASLAIDAVNLGTFDLNLVNGEMITSLRFANIFGYDEIRKRSDYIDAFHPDDLPARSKGHANALITGKLFYEARVMLKDDTARWIRIEGRTMYDKDKNPLRILGTALDIHDQLEAKQKEEKLVSLIADSEHLLRNITTAAPTGLWKSNEAGELNYVNQTWIDWTGLSFEESMGDGWMKAVVEEDLDKAINKFLHAIELRIGYEVEFRIKHTDGTLHWCIITGKPQYRNDGSFVGYIGACVDITEQKYLQQQKDNFIAIASHELKTPVTSIKAYTQVLERMLKAKGDLTEAGMIGKMDKQIDRLISLIGDLLDATKINTGKLQFNDRPFDFNEMLTDLIEDLEHSSSTHTFTRKFLADGFVFGDRERIGQVVTNLVTNAIKYSPNSKEIIIHSDIKGNEVHACVEDFGIGIPERSLEKVFEQFYRVSGDMQHTFPGLGLGLYISSEIIKREGGTIWVNSVEGKGSTFCFSLPLYKK